MTTEPTDDECTDEPEHAARRDALLAAILNKDADLLRRLGEA